MHLPEYVAIHRAAKIYRSLRSTYKSDEYNTYYSVSRSQTMSMLNEKIIQPTGETDEEFKSMVQLQLALEEILQFSIPGCRTHRYVSVAEVTCENKEHVVPILSCEIFDPLHTYMSVVVTKNTVLAISPFNNASVLKESKNEFVLELLPTEMVREYMSISTAEEKYKFLQEAPYITIPASEEEPEINFTLGKYLYACTFVFAHGLRFGDEVMENNFGDISQESIRLITKDSDWFLSAKRQFGLESVTSNMSDEVYPIGITDFMPLVVYTKNGDDYYDGTGTVMLSLDKSENGETVRRLKLSGDDNSSGIQREGEPSTAIGAQDQIVLLSPDQKDVVLSCEEGFVVGEYLVFKNGDAIQKIALVECVYRDEDEDFVPEVIGIESMSFRDRVGMEAMMGMDKKAIIKLAKKAGVHSQEFLSRILGILKLPVKYAADALKSTLRVFKKGIEYEKEDTLELREKLLNDELDLVTEKFLFWGQTLSLTTAISFILGNWWFGVFGFFHARHKVTKSKLKSIERLEMKLDHAIERLDVKIEAARGESDYKGVDALMREKELYENARFKLKDMKTDLVKKGSIKYETYDADLGLTPRERLEKQYQQERPVDLRHNYID